MIYEFDDCDESTDYEAEQERINKLTQNQCWITRDGRKIPINQMATSHIVNTMKMIVRNSDFSETSEEYMNLFIDELEQRTRYVESFAEKEFNKQMKSNW